MKRQSLYRACLFLMASFTLGALSGCSSLPEADSAHKPVAGEQTDAKDSSAASGSAVNSAGQ